MGPMVKTAEMMRTIGALIQNAKPIEANVYGMLVIDQPMLCSADPNKDRDLNPDKLTWGTKYFPAPPAIGSRVQITFNSLGTGTVIGYFREAGFLGVHVALDKAPRWHRDQYVGTEHEGQALVFGPEVKPLAL